MSKNDTSWGEVSSWYDDLLSHNEDSFQRQVILPNLLRVLDINKGDKVLDVACGNGFFADEFTHAGAEVVGVDVSEELIGAAKKRYGSNPGLKFIVSRVEKLPSSLENFDKAVIVLAVQNIEDVRTTIKNCNKALKPGGKLVIVMNHPAFRIPKASSWGWDDGGTKQHRNISAYMSELKEEINMTPGRKGPEKFTISFHRPLQFYFKIFRNSGFVVSRLEEWISHKKSQPGPRQKEEDRMRKELPLFLCLELLKI